MTKTVPTGSMYYLSRLLRLWLRVEREANRAIRPYASVDGGEPCAAK